MISIKIIHIPEMMVAYSPLVGWLVLTHAQLGLSKMVLPPQLVGYPTNDDHYWLKQLLNLNFVVYYSLP